MKKILLLSALALALPSARSEVTIAFQSDQLLDASNNPLANGRLALLIASVGTSTTAGTGFASLTPGSLAVGDYLNNGLYQILARAPIDPSTLAGGFVGEATELAYASGDFSSLSFGDQLAVVWFPTLNFNSDLTLLAGVSYGLYTDPLSVDWKVPADGSTISNVTVPSGTAASLVVSAVPEPATYAAGLALSALGFAALRRRQRAIQSA